MKQDNLNPSDSAKIIDEALSHVRNEKTGAYYYYILWGLILMIHFFLRYCKIVYPLLSDYYIDLIIYGVFPIGGILSFIRKDKDAQTENLVTKLEKVYAFGFVGFAICYAILGFVEIKTHVDFKTSLYPMLLGFTVFVTGGITGYKLSIVGGSIGMIISLFTLIVGTEWQYLLCSLASLICCVLPGLFMKQVKNV